MPCRILPPSSSRLGLNRCVFVGVCLFVFWMVTLCFPRLHSLQMPQFANPAIDAEVQYVQLVIRIGRSLKEAANLAKPVPFVIVSSVCAISHRLSLLLRTGMCAPLMSTRT